MKKNILFNSLGFLTIVLISFFSFLRVSQADPLDFGGSAGIIGSYSASSALPGGNSTVPNAYGSRGVQTDNAGIQAQVVSTTGISTTYAPSIITDNSGVTVNGFGMNYYAYNNDEANAQNRITGINILTNTTNSNQWLSLNGNILTGVTLTDQNGRVFTVDVNTTNMQNGIISITTGTFTCINCSISYNFTSPEDRREICPSDQMVDFTLTPSNSNPTTAVEGGSVTYSFTPGARSQNKYFSFICPTGTTCSYPGMQFGGLIRTEDVAGGKKWIININGSTIQYTISNLSIGTYNLVNTLDNAGSPQGWCDGASFGYVPYTLFVSRDNTRDPICDSNWHSVYGGGTTSDQPVGVYIPTGKDSANANAIGVLIRGTDNGLYYQACKFFGDNTKCSWNNTWQSIPGKTLNTAPFTYVTSTWEVAVRDGSNNVFRSRNFTGGWDSFTQDSSPTNQSWGTPTTATDSLGRFWKFVKNSDNTISYMCGTPKNDAVCNGITTTLNKDLSTGKYNAGPGATFSTDVFMTNSGTKVWTGQYYNLGTAFTNSNELWGGSRIHIPTDPVAEGQTVKFASIARTVPAKTISGPETKTLAFQMVQDSVEWIPSDLTDANAPSASICKVDVEVKNYCQKPQNISITLNRGAQTTATVTWDAISNAQKYHVRVADQTDLNARIDISTFSGGNCGAHYVCEDSVTGNTLTFPTISGHQYIVWLHADIDGQLCQQSDSYIFTDDTSALNFRVWQDDNGDGNKDASEKWLVDSTTNTAVPSCTASGVTYANVAGLNIVVKQNGTQVSTDKLGCNTGGSSLSKYLPVGTYTAEISVPSGWQLTSPASQPVTIASVVGQSSQNEQWFGMRPFPIPQNVTASCVGNNLSISWDRVSGANSQNYIARFYDETTPPGFDFSSSPVLNTNTYTVNNAIKGHKYSYWVHHTPPSGSPLEPENPTNRTAFVTCPPPEPPTFSGSCSANGKLGTLNWALPAGYTKSAIRIQDVTKTSEWIFKKDDFISPPYTKDFETDKNTIYDAWIHTVDSNGILSSIAPHATIRCGDSKPTISLTPSSFTFNGVSGQSTPPGQSMVIKNTGQGGSVLVWTATGVSSKPGVWCSVTPTSGALAHNATQTVSVNVNSPSNVGSFTDCGIRINDTNATNNPQDATVTYTVSLPPTPQNVNATCTNGTNLSMNWDHVASGHYYLARFYDETSKQLAAASAVITDNAYSITNATPGHDYSYWVHATNIDGTTVGSASPAENARVNVSCLSNVCGPGQCCSSSNCTPTPPTPDNSVCGQITISWTPGVGGGTVANYRVYRNSSNNFGTATNISGDLASTARSYVDTTVSGTNLYYYWVEARNSAGNAHSAISGGSVASLVCTANLSSSDKDIVSVTPKNGSVTNYSTTDCGASDTNTRIFRINDKVRFRINICNNNNLSKATASSIVVSDTLTNLQQSGGSWNVGSTWGTLVPVVSGTAPNQTLIFTVPNSLAKNTKGYIEFDAETSSSSSANTARYQNCVNIRYNNSTSNVSTGDICTPLYLFYQGGSVPGVIEVAP